MSDTSDIARVKRWVKARGKGHVVAYTGYALDEYIVWLADYRRVFTKVATAPCLLTMSHSPKISNPGMSYLFTAKIICDGCGDSLAGEIETRATYVGQPLWTAKKTAKQAGWVTLSRGRYRTERHFCSQCADKPIVIGKSRKLL